MSDLPPNEPLYNHEFTCVCCGYDIYAAVHYGAPDLCGSCRIMRDSGLSDTEIRAIQDRIDDL